MLTGKWTKMLLRRFSQLKVKIPSSGWRKSASPSLTKSLPKKFFSSRKEGDGKGKTGKGIPDNFFDPELEEEQEFLDAMTCLKLGKGLEGMTTLKDASAIDIDEKEEAKGSVRGEMDMLDRDPSKWAEAFPGYPEVDYEDEGGYQNLPIPSAMLDFSQNWRKNSTPDVATEKFVKNTSRDKYRADEQVTLDEGVA